MKMGKGILGAALFLGMVNCASAASFYNDINYGDHHETLYAGTTSYVQSLAGFNDDLSSLKVFTGECVASGRRFKHGWR